MDLDLQTFDLDLQTMDLYLQTFDLDLQTMGLDLQTIWLTDLLPMLMLLLLVLFGRLVQVVVLQIFVIQIVAIQILVVQMIAATHPNCHGRVLPHSKGHIHGQRMVTHNYTVLNNHKNVTMLVVSEVNKG